MTVSQELDNTLKLHLSRTYFVFLPVYNETANHHIIVLVPGGIQTKNTSQMHCHAYGQGVSFLYSHFVWLVNYASLSDFLSLEFAILNELPSKRDTIDRVSSTPSHSREVMPTLLKEKVKCTGKDDVT